MTDDEAKRFYDDSVAPTVSQIRPILAGLDRRVQGAVLADLVSIYFAGHHPSVRISVIDLWTNAMLRLIPESEKEIFPGGWPQSQEQMRAWLEGREQANEKPPA